MWLGRCARGGSKKPRAIHSRCGMELLVESLQHQRDRCHRRRPGEQPRREPSRAPLLPGCEPGRGETPARRQPAQSTDNAPGRRHASVEKRARRHGLHTERVVGDRRSRASSGAARRAASCVRLSRCIPNVARRNGAIVRAKSSAAAREAATIRYSVSGEVSRTNRRAASRRTVADEERTTRTHHPLRTLCRILRKRQRYAAVMSIIAEEAAGSPTLPGRLPARSRARTRHAGAGWLRSTIGNLQRNKRTGVGPAKTPSSAPQADSAER